MGTDAVRANAGSLLWDGCRGDGYGGVVDAGNDWNEELWLGCCSPFDVEGLGLWGDECGEEEADDEDLLELEDEGRHDDIDVGVGDG